MALTSYSELQEEIADWLNREDLTDKIPTFITLLESQVDRTLRTRDALTESEELDIEANGAVILPDDFASLETAVLNSDPIRVIEYASRAEVNKVRTSGVTGYPYIYSLTSTSIALAPLPDSTYTVSLTYWRKITRLSTTDTTNWLLAKHPDVYLYGSLLQAAPYLKNDERVQLWSGALQSLLDDIRIQDERYATGGQPLKMRFRRAY